MHLTMKEVCDRLQLSRHTIRRMLLSGRLQGVKTSPSKTGRWRISEESYEAFVRGSENS